MELTAYHGAADPDDVWTIGWGHTGPEVKEGMTITREEADELFKKDTAHAVKTVNEVADKVPTTQSQFDAMVSLVYNIGSGAFLGSTLRRMHEAGNYFQAARSFQSWIFSNGQPRRGLLRRRIAEASIYCEEGW